MNTGVRSINHYFNSVKTGFTSFSFTVHNIVRVTLQPSAPQSLAMSTGANRKHSDQQTKQFVQLFPGAVTARKDQGHSASFFFLLIVSTEERSNRQEEERYQIKSSEREELTLF